MIGKKQKEVLDFIQTYNKKKGYSPSLEEIAKQIKVASVSTAHHHIKKLEAEGLIHKEVNQPRAVTTKGQISSIQIQILGTIAAGQPIEALENVDDFIALPKSDLSQGKHYALRVEGSSMIEEGIFDGDIVVIREQKDAENGQTVVAIIDDNQATLKKLYRERGRFRLQPANQALLPFYRTEVEVRGVVVKIIRQFDTALHNNGALELLLRKMPLTDHVRRTSNPDPLKEAKPFMQWVGGKREMVQQYKGLLPKTFATYYEPFVGGGALFFHLKPEKAVLSDNNTELVKTYQAICNQPEEIIRLLKQFKERHSKELFTQVRNLDREISIFHELTDAEIAARMIYLNQTCFNGLYRVNQKGQFNVPIGSSLNRLICDEYTIRNASKSLKKVIVKEADFATATQEAKNNDFIYLDPPYFPISKYSDFTRYTKEKFYTEDQVRLKKEVDRLRNRGCKIMISNSDCEFIRNLYSDYKLHTVLSSRSLNSKADKRGKITELVITSY